MSVTAIFGSRAWIASSNVKARTSAYRLMPLYWISSLKTRNPAGISANTSSFTFWMLETFKRMIFFITAALQKAKSIVDGEWSDLP
jgi:hypothetical protein